MKTIDYSYFIERYNAGEMDDKETNWFELELKDNPSLQKELIIRKKTDVILSKPDIINLRNKLVSIEKSREESRIQSARAKVKGSVLVKYAAVIIGIALIGGYSLLYSLKQPRAIPYSDYFEPYTLSITRSLNANDAESYFSLGVASLNNKNFEQAIKYLTLTLEDEPGKTQARFYRGTANYNLENYSAAKPDFEAVRNDGISLYRDDAQWLLVECYLRTNENDKAKENLREIITSESSYRTRARKLLRDIK